jgi:small subunit ribosomal protein S20
MANTPSAKKAARKIEHRTAVNRMRRTFMRGSIRKLEEAIAAGDRDVAQATFKDVQPVIMKAASKGVITRNTASRKVSRLSARVKAISA